MCQPLLHTSIKYNLSHQENTDDEKDFLLAIHDNVMLTMALYIKLILPVN